MPADAPRKSRPAPSTRFGWVLRRLRWPVLVLWVLAVVTLHPLASNLSKVTDDTSSANLSPSAPSTRVAVLQEGATHRIGQPTSNQAVVVFARRGGLTSADLIAVADARTAVGLLSRTIDGLETPGPARRSADGQAADFTASVASQADDATSIDTAAVKAIRNAVQTAAKTPGNGLQGAVTGSAAENADTGQGSQTRLLLSALIIVVLILLFVYRSALLWLLPVLGALGAIIVAQAAAHGLANAGLTVSPLSSSILIVLVFGAASDYALLLTHRYREELRHHLVVDDAMAATMRAILPTLAASAATVVGAMLCLLAAESASLHGLGPVGAISIVAALLAQTSFLPALLLVLGRRAFWPFTPNPAATDEDSRVWSAVGTRIARRPGPVVLGGVVVLTACCLGLGVFHIDNSPIANLKGNPQSVTGAQLVAEHFGPGALDPVVLLVPPREATAAVNTTRGTPGVATISPQVRVEGYASYSVTLAINPYSTQAGNTVKDLRHQLSLTAPGSLVGGNPGISYDLTQAATRDTVVLIPLVLIVILVVIAVLLQAIVAPLLLVATTALSFAASFGLSNLLWRHVFGYSGVNAELPLYIFIFLIALGVDYNIFLTARIREEARTSGTTRGTLRGLTVTGGVITAAGVVLAGTFLALTQNPQVDITEVGIAIAIGVLLDTLLVRTVLVPAAFLAMKETIWWPAKRNKKTSAGDGTRPVPSLPLQKAKTR